MENQEAAQLNWKSLLENSVSGISLKRLEAESVMQAILSGQVSDVRLAGLLVALRAKKPSISELTGFADALLTVAEPIGLSESVVDIVGTGGSSHGAKHALNVSTMASFVVAAAGVPVCKHGNRKASSTSGAFDFLEALGANIELSAEKVSQSVSEVGLGFVYAKSFHPAMRYAGPVRKELGISTVFNLLGPLAHPGKVKRLVLGTPEQENAEKLASVLYERSVLKAWVLSGHDGLDELTLAGPTTIFEVTESGISNFQLSPSEIGISEVASSDEIPGGSPHLNVEIFNEILRGSSGPQTDIVLLNAAAALVVADYVEDISAGLTHVRRVVREGKVADLVKRYIEFSHKS